MGRPHRVVELIMGSLVPRNLGAHSPGQLSSINLTLGPMKPQINTFRPTGSLLCRASKERHYCCSSSSSSSSGSNGNKENNFELIRRHLVELEEPSRQSATADQQQQQPRVTLFAEQADEEEEEVERPQVDAIGGGGGGGHDEKVKQNSRELEANSLSSAHDHKDNLIANDQGDLCRTSRGASANGYSHSHSHGYNSGNIVVSESTRRLLSNSNEDYERALWRAARDYQQTDHYDYSLFGLDVHLDQAVARHQREAMLYNQDRHLKEEQAKQVAPNKKQSPIAIMSMNPTYELQNKPLVLEYPATVENLRLNNTGFSWEVKMPYQISMTTALYGAHLNTMHRYRLDQFHCHWGEQDNQGSEHTVDNRSYSAELHFVHYNMEKYHTFSKAARHPDGLVVMGVFVDAREDYHNHAELEKIVTHLKSVQLKGDHSIIRQAIRIENLLPANRSYWSYQGSLTTPPYLESVTWFVLKYPIKCNSAQLHKFRGLKSTLSHDSEGVLIKSNHRKTQPLNGRTIVMYNEPR